MTKEELEKEAEEYADWFWGASPSMMKALAKAYIKGAEPREKRIEELEKQFDLKEKALSKAKKETKRIADRVNKDKRRLIRRKAELEAENEQIKNSDTLCKLIGEQKRKIAELEQQIEKMKCCENCGWYYLQQHWRESKEIDESRMFHCGTCGNKRNWKLKEIKEK